MGAELAESFRRALRQRADTVHVITYRAAAGHVEGMTATAVTSLSVSPPAILVCINRSTHARDAIAASQKLGVSVLSTSQAGIAKAAGHASGNRSFGGLLTPEDEAELTPVLVDALATFQCRVVEAHDLFTHTVFAAEVLRAEVGPGEAPLLHHLGSYFSVAPITPPDPKPP